MTTSAVKTALSNLGSDADTFVAQTNSHLDDLTSAISTLQTWDVEPLVLPYVFCWPNKPTDSGNDPDDPGDLGANHPYLVNLLVSGSDIESGNELTLADALGPLAQPILDAGKPVGLTLTGFGEDASSGLTTHTSDQSSGTDVNTPWNQNGVDHWIEVMSAFCAHWHKQGYPDPTYLFLYSLSVANIDIYSDFAAEALLDDLDDEARAATVTFPWDPTGADRTLDQMISDTGIQGQPRATQKQFLQSILRMANSYAFKKAAYDIAKEFWPDVKCCNVDEITNTATYANQEDEPFLRWYTPSGDFYAPIMTGEGAAESPYEYTTINYPLETDSSKNGVVWVPQIGEHSQDLYNLSNQLRYLIENHSIEAIICRDSGTPSAAEWDQLANAADVMLRTEYRQVITPQKPTV